MDLLVFYFYISYPLSALQTNPDASIRDFKLENPASRQAASFVLSLKITHGALGIHYHVSMCFNKKITLEPYHFPLYA